MPVRKLETDYLVIGCGASALAFTDALVASSDKDVVIVDLRHAPGGHWNDAYGFVRLHQPSNLYGVNSLPLGSDTIDREGNNATLYERASGIEICAYYDSVMRDRLLPTARVRYFPMCRYVGAHRFVSSITGAEYDVNVREKVVDARYLEPELPGASNFPFEVSSDARCVPVSELPLTREPANGYIIIGAGKTAIDACMWLLELGVPPEAINWVKPRESWLLNRALFQGGKLVGPNYEAMSLAVEAAASAGSVEELYRDLLAIGWTMRIDEQVDPTMFKGAMTTTAELKKLRRIENIVRLGHVRRVERERVVLDGGSIATGPGYLHVHCAASGLRQAPAVPIFTEQTITLQRIRAGVPFNAALVGYVEATYRDVPLQNHLCPPTPPPHVAIDLLRGLLAGLQTGSRWSEEPTLEKWVAASRLNPLHNLELHMDEVELASARARLANHGEAALANLATLIRASSSGRVDAPLAGAR